MGTENNITGGGASGRGWLDLAPPDGWRISMHANGRGPDGTTACTAVEVFGATWAHGLWKRHVMRSICKMASLNVDKVSKLNWRVERSKNKKYHPFTFILVIWHHEMEELF